MSTCARRHLSRWGTIAARAWRAPGSEPSVGHLRSVPARRPGVRRSFGLRRTLRIQSLGSKMLPSGHGVEIDDARGQVGQLLVGRLFLVEGTAENVLVAGAAEQPGVGAHGAVAGDLVVLDPLRGGDQAGVADVLI